VQILGEVLRAGERIAIKLAVRFSGYMVTQ
jgi:hypothetical protein